MTDMKNNFLTELDKFIAETTDKYWYHRDGLFEFLTTKKFLKKKADWRLYTIDYYSSVDKVYYALGYLHKPFYARYPRFTYYRLHGLSISGNNCIGHENILKIHPDCRQKISEADPTEFFKQYKERGRCYIYELSESPYLSHEYETWDNEQGEKYRECIICGNRQKGITRTEMVVEKWIDVEKNIKED